MEQKRLEEMAVNGHSFIITGSCGTGKTFTLRQIIRKLSQLKKTVAVTATTGMAALELGMNTSTLHHWSGILDGRYSGQKLKELYQNDDRYSAAKQRILQADCLIIDEISMLTQKIFELVESVCRSVREKDQCFGGLQVIGCGDFKQLPPVPDKFLNDEGKHCFESSMFQSTFPHHVNLTKVMRQTDQDLAAAVKELCDGSPSESTIQLMRSLDKQLDIPDVIRLYGTNFDVRYVNEEMLDTIENEACVFKSTDEGIEDTLKADETLALYSLTDFRNKIYLISSHFMILGTNFRPKQLLVKMPVPKTLLLKEGAPVVLVKNISNQLLNGQRGVVHKLSRDAPPIINFNGNLHQIYPERFEIFDSTQNKTLASRLQIPVMLCFAMTVHRAQGQTIENLYVDCSSFFAPGQMGVAVGRAVSKKTLCIKNFSLEAATLKHPESVYEFYTQPFRAVEEDLSCCTKINILTTMPQQSVGTTDSSSDDFNNDDFSIEDMPSSPCPYDIKEFLDANSSAQFKAIISEDFIFANELRKHLDYIYHNVQSCAGNSEKNMVWNDSYKKLNMFLVGKDHLQSIKTLFKTSDISKLQNKFASKLVMWIMDKIIEDRTKHLISEQSSLASSSTVSEPSDVGSAKLRYLAGACVIKIRKRLRETVNRTFGNVGNKSKLTRQLSYRKEKMLKMLAVSESSVDIHDPSLSEIQVKQNKSHGLTIVNDEVFDFFKQLNATLQLLLTNERLHLTLDFIHRSCRTSIDNNNSILSNWINLFSSINTESFEDEIFLDLIADLFQSVTEHFVRLSIVDSLKQFKRSLPRKKKQALRTKLQAIGEQQNKKRKIDQTETSSNVTICPVCDNVCEEKPPDPRGYSIGCDNCKSWFHYGCVNITGNEAFLKSSRSKWFCLSCTRNRKGRNTKPKH